MRTPRFLFVLFFLLLLFSSFSQEPLKKVHFFKPLYLYADINSHVTWHLDEGMKGGWMDWINFSSNLTFRNFSIVLSDQVRFYDNGVVVNYWEQAYVNLFHYFSRNKFPPRGTRVYLKLGLIKWQSTYTDIILMSEKYMADYLSPENRPLYGAGAGFYIPLIRKNILNAQFDDLMGWYQDSPHFTNMVKNAFLQGNLTIYKKLSVHAQAGLGDGYSKVLHYAYIAYKPKIESLYFDLRLGYLPGYESTPWGISIEVRRPFNFVELGGYYQYRFGWDPHAPQIAGFTFRFLKPKILVDIWNSYNFWYNFYDNTFYFSIPIIRFNLGFK